MRTLTILTKLWIFYIWRAKILPKILEVAYRININCLYHCQLRRGSTWNCIFLSHMKGVIQRKVLMLFQMFALFNHIIEFCFCVFWRVLSGIYSGQIGSVQQKSWGPGAMDPMPCQLSIQRWAGLMASPLTGGKGNTGDREAFFQPTCFFL